MLPVGNAELGGGLFHDAGQRSVVGVAHEGAEMMHDVVIESAHEPTDERVGRRVIGGRGEDMVHAIFELAAIGREVRAIDGVCVV